MSSVVPVKRLTVSSEIPSPIRPLRLFLLRSKGLDPTSLRQTERRSTGAQDGSLVDWGELRPEPV